MAFSAANVVICADAYWVPLSVLNRFPVNADAGSQYTSLRLTEHLALEEIRPSIGSVGDAYDTQSMMMLVGDGSRV